MPFYDCFVWLAGTAAGRWVSGSTGAFATVEAAHILGLTLLGGSVLVGNLATIGALLRETSAAQLTRGLQPVFATGLAVAIASGLLLVASAPFKYYSNPLFPIKLWLLAAAIVLHLLLSVLIAKRPDRRVLTRVGAAGSLLLWTAVATAGRWIGLI